jgi:16S rRNA (adenine1518-N6/adenine1519-N6)-dimethyltransferase
MIPASGGTGFQTQTMLRAMLDEAGLSPRHAYGQHFLVDRNLMQKLVDGAGIAPRDCVLEVGAATGSLTALLAERAAWVVAVEIDEALAALARRNLSRFTNVTLLCTDALEKKSAISRVVLASLAEAQCQADGTLMMVANLPYDIATPLVMNILLCDLPFKRLCFTVQAEVADRFLADVGSAAYGPVSVITQLLTTGSRVCRIPPQAFWPAPQVHSMMVRLDRRPEAQAAVSNPSDLAGFVRSFFLHRRKTMGHIAKQRQDAGRCLAGMKEAGIDLRHRPEAVSVEQWVNLHRAVCC